MAIHLKLEDEWFTEQFWELFHPWELLNHSIAECWTWDLRLTLTSVRHKNTQFCDNSNNEGEKKAKLSCNVWLLSLKLIIPRPPAVSRRTLF